jgi:hypothetical protein
MTHPFPIDFLRAVLDEDCDPDEPRKRLRHKEPVGRTWEDGLVEGWRAVFEHEGRLYGFEYRKGSDYYEGEVGPVDPFDHLPYRTETVDCYEVRSREITIIKYEKV